MAAARLSTQPAASEAALMAAGLRGDEPDYRQLAAISERSTCPRCSGYGFVHDTSAAHDKPDARTRCKKCRDCPTCEGPGITVGMAACDACAARGFVHPPNKGKHAAPAWHRCDRCTGCSDCQGYGAVAMRPPSSSHDGLADSAPLVSGTAPDTPSLGGGSGGGGGGGGGAPPAMLAFPLPGMIAQIPPHLIQLGPTGVPLPVFLGPVPTAATVSSLAHFQKQLQEIPGQHAAPPDAFDPRRFTQPSFAGFGGGGAMSEAAVGPASSSQPSPQPGTASLAPPPPRPELQKVACPMCDGRGFRHDRPAKHEKSVGSRCKQCVDCRGCAKTGIVIGRQLCTECHTHGFTHQSTERPHDVPDHLRCFFCKNCPKCAGSGLEPMVAA
ncbi:hypothetical protein CXG81DRAFT_26500 [Caulochytrium protostelioides]|uniref:Uncharacterized protein n=1 Tax=Caulochytrium protostelioides TaxID=1555241 RepID=A0A4V1IUJ7_9FUNG|nr:hypothetical protein CXG81DRAFT_26500 [Caulochytrium protostelioides]|eukprot:RKP00799.1 hypothetical protein CXG81DRAFT_26500 [Caulochytrium protostelioides]